MERSWKRTALVVGIVAVNVLLDQVTKEVARSQLQGQADQVFWGGFFRLTFVENRGAFLSMGAQLSDQLRALVLQVFPIILLVGLLWYTLRSRSLGRWQVIAMSFIVGGGLSNIYDRLLYGQVVDFMHMRILGMQTGIFNTADMSIMFGLFVILALSFQKTPPPATDRDAHSEPTSVAASKTTDDPQQ